MSLVENKLADSMKSFIKEVNAMKQEDADKAIDRYCEKYEELIYEAVKGITITIPPGAIQVSGSPSAQVNLAPIVLEGMIT